MWAVLSARKRTSEEKQVRASEISFILDSAEVRMKNFAGGRGQWIGYLRVAGIETIGG